MQCEKSASIKPRIIIHGGAGNITRQNLPQQAYNAYHDALLDILHDAYIKVRQPDASALDIASHAVTLLENNGLFNSGHGAVYTTAGTHELEASVMVSRGYRKRGVGVMNVKRAKNPILLAKEMLMRGEKDDGGGAQGHCQLQGETCNKLVEQWGLETVRPSYFWTKRRWDEHRRGLGKAHDDEMYKRHKRRADELVIVDEQGRLGAVEGAGSDNLIDETSWDGHEYLPQGTVGAVVMDSMGTLCVATSTGGLTNKLPGRIGDTPTIGAGFFAEEWMTSYTVPAKPPPLLRTPLASFASTLFDCLPSLSGYMSLPSASAPTSYDKKPVKKTRAVAMCGTGNGDSFLRLSAVRTAAAISRFSRNQPWESGIVSLQDAVSTVAGPRGMLQQSAEDRWLKTGEGEGGIIGLEMTDGKGEVVFDFNCGGMFHAWVDDEGQVRFQVFRDEV